MSDESRTGAQRIVDERKRQIEKLDWTPAHDDCHDDCGLALAAVCYAAQAALVRVYVKKDYAAGFSLDDPWPWDNCDARNHHGNAVLPYPLDEAHRIRLLEKAGALIAAEIDRLLRERAIDGPSPKDG